jgi:hypothetical protein
MARNEGDAAVVPTSNGRSFQMECPSCGVLGRGRRWHVDADLDADRHNATRSHKQNQATFGG